MTKIVKFEISPLKSKKYRAWLKDGERVFKVDFGAKGYAQYRDQTPLKAYSSLDHNDLKRRERYYKRHSKDYPMYSADWFSKKYLW